MNTRGTVPLVESHILDLAVDVIEAPDGLLHVPHAPPSHLNELRLLCLTGLGSNSTALIH